MLSFLFEIVEVQKSGSVAFVPDMQLSRSILRQLVHCNSLSRGLDRSAVDLDLNLTAADL